MTPVPMASAPMTSAQVRRRLLTMLRPMRGLVIGSILCRIVNQGLGVAIPVIAAGSVVRIAMGSGPEPTALVLLLTGLALVKGLFRYLEQFTGHAVAFQLLSKLRADTYRALEPLAPTGLEDDRSGDLVTRVIGDVDRIEPFFAHTIAPLAGAVIVPTLTVIGMGLATNWTLAATLVPFLALVVALPWLRRRRVGELAPELRTASGAAAASLTDAGQGIREIVAFDAADRIVARLDRVEEPVATLRSQLARIAAVRTGLVDLVAAGAVVAVAVVGVAQMDTAALSLDGLAMALVAVWVVAVPARAVEEIAADLEQSLAAGRRIFELADRTPPIPDPGSGGPTPRGGAVRLDAVTVRHSPGAEPALDEVTLDLPERGLIGLVGPSGSGKSTLVDVLLRFRLPESGQVSIGGADLRSIPTAALRAHLAVVPQRPELFHGTIADNLRLADPGATERRLWSVLERVALADWVRGLDRNLETHVGELGDTMSGGQRQRLALARALLRPGAILILDEATSELDPGTERAVMATLGVVATRHTVLFVAHRLGAVTQADHIVVFDAGRVVEQGTHEELVADNGLYAGLWRRHTDAAEPV